MGLHFVSFVNSNTVTGSFKCVKISNNWCHIHSVKQLRLYLDLKPRLQFADVLCSLLGGCNTWTGRLSDCFENPWFSKAIVSGPKYFELLVQCNLCGHFIDSFDDIWASFLCLLQNSVRGGFLSCDGFLVNPFVALLSRSFSHPNNLMPTAWRV